MKTLFRFLTQGMLFVALCLVLTGCEEFGMESNPTPSYISFNSKAVTLNIDQTVTYKAIVAGTAVVIYSSSNEAVATVDQTGKVTALTAGTTTITAQVTGYDAAGKKIYTPEEKSYTVTVVDPVNTLTLDQTALSVSIGATKTITATVNPTGYTVKWTSSDEAVATVENGVVTGVAAGTATITAKAGGKTATCAVTVTAVPVFALNEYNCASWDGTVVTYTKYSAPSYTEIANGYTGSITSGWYTVTGDNVTITGDQMPTGDVHLILCDGAKLTINGKLNCFFYSCNLYIYGQAAGTGILKVKDVNDFTTLNNKTSKMLEIHGGDITVENAYPAFSMSAYGIDLGGGLRMYGGKLTTTAPTCGIKFGSDDLEIYGGEVTATSTAGYDHAIYRPTGTGVLTVYGGKLKATATGTSYAIAAPIKSGTPGIKFYFADTEAGLDTAVGNTYDGTTATPTNKFAKAE